MRDRDFALGFIAGEGAFTLSMSPVDGLYYARMRFQIRVHEKDKEVVEEMREMFNNVGSITDIDGRDTIEWRVGSKEEMEYLRDTIESDAPEIWWNTEKARNFEVWSDILDIHLDGRTTADQCIEMCELAKAGLNVDNGITEERWDGYIESLSERA